MCDRSDIVWRRQCVVLISTIQWSVYNVYQDYNYQSRAAALWAEQREIAGLVEEGGRVSRLGMVSMQVDSRGGCGTQTLNSV